MRRIALLAVGILVLFGCARVRVEAPKEAFKVDISMRLDIYQHVQNDINNIEDLVSGGKAISNKPQGHSFYHLFAAQAYAQEGLSPEVEKAAIRRRDRKTELSDWEQKGALGENKLGLVEVRAADKASSLQSLVSQENSDRMIIYQAIAQKNGVAVKEIQEMYAKRLQEDAPAGTPVESSGSWIIKK